jgi:phenylpropionate dioxygenase-like ring-hydroxylating dioxygenase large terminal subunit
MLTKEENDLLTQVGPVTPMGNLMRRFWQPVALSEELQEGVPLSIRLLGENLVLFRDEQGKLGLLGLRCSHRGVDLSYGRIEDGGLRCIYHGWLYDVQGNCLEQPGEPKGSDFHKKTRHLAYPCQELGGIIFAYMGPSDPPLLPRHEPLVLPERHRHVEKYFVNCNYLQSYEGGVDPSHVSYLHRVFQSNEIVGRYQRVSVRDVDNAPAPDLLEGAKEDISPSIEMEIAGFGLRMLSCRNLGARNLLRITTVMLPNSSAVPGGTAGDGYTLSWHVPVDDTHTWRYHVHFRRGAPIDKEVHSKMWEGEMTKDCRLVRNRENRYLQDREVMKRSTFSGLGHHIPIQDIVVTELQGEIQDRTEEQLGYSDKALIAMRRGLLNGVRELEESGEPADHPQDGKLRPPLPAVISETVPASEDWRAYAKRRIEEMEGLALSVAASERL